MKRTPSPDLADFDAALRRWSDTVWRLVCCRMRAKHDAEDAFQNTFLALCRAHPRFASLEHQKAWLLRTACNCCNQMMRARRAHPTDALDSVSAVETPAVDDHQELHEALAHLTDKQRTAVHLHYFEGYTTDEIARITGEKPATVRSHLYRARQALRIELEREGARP